MPAHLGEHTHSHWGQPCTTIEQRTARGDCAIETSAMQTKNGAIESSSSAGKPIWCQSLLRASYKINVSSLHCNPLQHSFCSASQQSGSKEEHCSSCRIVASEHRSIVASEEEQQLGGKLPAASHPPPLSPLHQNQSALHYTALHAAAQVALSASSTWLSGSSRQVQLCHQGISARSEHPHPQS